MIIKGVLKITPDIETLWIENISVKQKHEEKQYNHGRAHLHNYFRCDPTKNLHTEKSNTIFSVVKVVTVENDIMYPDCKRLMSIFCQ